MSDFVLIDGDLAMFMPNFGAAVVVVRPGTLSGSGPGKACGKAICVDGDEGGVSVPGCVYLTPQYSIPGTGTLSIDSLAGDQKAAKTKTGDKAVLLKGSTFTAKFEVQSPAMQPPPGPGSPIPDSTTQYSGSGQFVTTNFTVKAG
ncbi:MAG: hypothetical protein MUE49_01275 [Rhodospirillales bacterium]|jgi:hypothetical protein|nr:hypothetical protein [Rhodospirillales bacterium]